MDANTVTAICATIIAVVSLSVSINEAQAVRRHNRHSIRPLLELQFKRRSNGETGIRLSNYGLGPAVITKTILILDDKPLGPWDEPTVNKIRDSLVIRPHATTFHQHQTVAAGYEAFLLSLDGYDREEHHWFWELIRHRIRLEIHYESLYGGEKFKVASDMLPGA